MPDSYVAPPIVKTEYFTQMRVHYADAIVPPPPPGQNFGQLTYINQEVYKVSRPTLIDYIAITEETLSCNGAQPGVFPSTLPAIYQPGNGPSALANLRVNWWVTDRPRAALRLRSPWEYHNYMDRDATSVLAAATLQAEPSITWKFRRPWVYKPGNSVVLEWTYVTGQWQLIPPPPPPIIQPQPPAFPPFRFIMYGVGVRTRSRRIFEFETPPLNPPAPMAPPGPPIGYSSSGSFTQHEFVANLTDEPYEIDGITLSFSTEDFRPPNFPPYDMRMLNMLRLRICPSQSEPISDDPVPLLMYGVDGGGVGRIVYYQPTGGPILLQPGQSIGWEVQSAFPNPPQLLTMPNINLQVALIGRTAPREVAL